MDLILEMAFKEPENPINNCPICKSDDLIRYPNTHPSGWKRCKSCGVGFYYIPLTEAQHEDYYRNKYRMPSYPDANLESQKDRAFIQEKFLGDLEPKTALDFGCGQAMLLQGLHKRFRTDCYGIELTWRDHKTLANAPIKLFEKLEQLPEMRFDFILSSHSIEHVPDPISIINQLKDRLANNGTMLFEVPYGGANYPHLFSFMNDQVVKRMFDICHLQIIKKLYLEKKSWLFLLKSM